MSDRFTDRRPEIAARRSQFEQLKWQAATAGAGYILTRERRLFGAIYMLTPLEGPAIILYSLAEVRAYLEQRSTPNPLNR